MIIADNPHSAGPLLPVTDEIIACHQATISMTQR
jgi:hypothetical protein